MDNSFSSKGREGLQNLYANHKLNKQMEITYAMEKVPYMHIKRDIPQSIFVIFYNYSDSLQKHNTSQFRWIYFTPKGSLLLKRPLNQA